MIWLTVFLALLSPVSAIAGVMVGGQIQQSLNCHQLEQQVNREDVAYSRQIAKARRDRLTTRYDEVQQSARKYMKFRARQAGFSCTYAVAAVLFAVRAITVVVLGDQSHPVGSIARHSGHSGRRHNAGQQPKEVPMAALDGISGAPIVAMELIVSQVRFEAGASWHTLVPQRTTRHRIICSDWDAACGFSRSQHCWP